MEKSTEERLAALESGVTRLAKMGDCIFDMLVAMRRSSVLTSRGDRAVKSVTDSVELSHQRQNRGMGLLFGAVAFINLAVAIPLLFSSPPQDSITRMIAFALFFIALALLLFSACNLVSALRQDRVTAKESAKARDDLADMVEDEASINRSLARILDEWKKLAPDTSASEINPED